jgi:hypothetical protein
MIHRMIIRLLNSCPYSALLETFYLPSITTAKNSRTVSRNRACGGYTGFCGIRSVRLERISFFAGFSSRKVMASEYFPCDLS